MVEINPKEHFYLSWIFHGLDCERFVSRSEERCAGVNAERVEVAKKPTILGFLPLFSSSNGLLMMVFLVSKGWNLV